MVRRRRINIKFSNEVKESETNLIIKNNLNDSYFTDK